MELPFELFEVGGGGFVVVLSGLVVLPGGVDAW